MARLCLAPSISLRSGSPGFVREMRHATDRIAVMPRLMPAGDPSRGSLQVVPLPIAAPDRPAGLILPDDRPLPAGSWTAFVRPGIAVAVPAGTPHPDVLDEAALRRAVLEGGTLCWFTGPGGDQLRQLWERWGLAD